MAAAAVPTLPPVQKAGPTSVPALHAKLNKGPGKIGLPIFGLILIVGAIYAGMHLVSDLSTIQ